MALATDCASVTLLMPPSLRDWLPEDHLAYFISDAVEAMDLSRFEERYGDYKPRSGKKGKLFKMHPRYNASREAPGGHALEHPHPRQALGWDF